MEVDTGLRLLNCLWHHKRFIRFGGKDSDEQKAVIAAVRTYILNYFRVTPDEERVEVARWIEHYTEKGERRESL